MGLGIRHHSHPWVVNALLWCVHNIPSFKFVGLIGYMVEWTIEMSHNNTRLHHILHQHASKMGLLAVTMVILGHATEHFHQEEEIEETVRTRKAPFTFGLNYICRVSLVHFVSNLACRLRRRKGR